MCLPTIRDCREVLSLYLSSLFVYTPEINLKQFSIPSLELKNTVLSLRVLLRDSKDTSCNCAEHTMK